MKTIQKTAVTLAVSSLFSTGAFAQAAPAAPEVSPVTANVTVASSYAYRGLTQSNYRPAIQGGFDYAHESGFYIGNWNSSISWISDGYSSATPNSVKTTSAPIEMDFYAGFKKELISEGFASDVGVLHYYYPTTYLPKQSSTNASVTADPTTRQTSGVNPSTTEIYLAQNFTFGPVTGFGKFSYSLTDLFGIYNSKGSHYTDLTANYDLGIFGLTLNGHVGYQYVPNSYTLATGANRGTYDLSYTDYKIGLTKDFGGGLSGSAAYVGTNIKSYGANYAYTTSNGGSAGKGTAIATLTKTF